MTRCPKCGHQQPDSVAVCDCGFDLDTYRQQQRRVSQARDSELRPFRLLAFFRALLWVTGGVCLIAGLAGAVLVIPDSDDLWRPAFVALAGGVAAVPYFVGAEVLALLLRINDQQTAIQEMLQRQGQMREPGA